MTAFAVVTAAQKINPADAMHPADNDQVSVIDLSRPAKPRLLQTVAVGAVGVSGVAMNRAQNLVLVAAKMSDAVVICALPEKSSRWRARSIWAPRLSPPMWCSRPMAAMLMWWPRASTSSWS